MSLYAPFGCNDFSQMASKVKSTKYLKEVVTSVLFKVFQHIELGGTLPNAFYEARITLIPKTEKDTTRKEHGISLMTIHASILKYSSKLNSAAY